MNGLPMTGLEIGRASLSGLLPLITLNPQRLGLEGRFESGHMRATAEQSPHGLFH